MSACTVATNNLFYKSYQLFKHCTIHDHFRALWHRQDCLELVKTELRASLCKILISSFAHKMDFAHNFSVDFF